MPDFRSGWAHTGGASVEHASEIVGLVDGLTVATSVKHGDMSNPIDPLLAEEFASTYRNAHRKLIADGARP